MIVPQRLVYETHLLTRTAPTRKSSLETSTGGNTGAQDKKLKPNADRLSRRKEKQHGNDTSFRPDLEVTVGPLPRDTVTAGFRLAPSPSKSRTRRRRSERQIHAGTLVEAAAAATTRARRRRFQLRPPPPQTNKKVNNKIDATTAHAHHRSNV